MSGRYIPDVIIVSVICCVPVFIPNTDQKVNNRRDFRHDSPSVMIDNDYKHLRMIPWFARFSVVKRLQISICFSFSVNFNSLPWLFSVTIIIF